MKKIDKFQNFKVLLLAQKLSKSVPVLFLYVLPIQTKCENFKSFGSFLDNVSFLFFELNFQNFKKIFK